MLAVNARVKSKKLLLDLERRRVYCINMRPADTHTGAVPLEGAMILAVATRTLGRHPEGLSMIARALKLPEEM